jgi:uncharacterized protein (TIGR02145 family)
MKTFKYFFAVAVLPGVFAVNAQNSDTNSEAVMINGVKWATRNVDSTGVFAASPEIAGRFYRWNSKQHWTALDIDSVNAFAQVKTWEKSNDPSPSGYRIPSKAEWDKLLDTSKVTNRFTNIGRVSGIKFTDKANGNSIFLPAAGCRSSYSPNEKYNSHLYGHYWSSTQDNNCYAYIFFQPGSDEHNVNCREYIYCLPDSSTQNKKCFSYISCEPGGNASVFYGHHATIGMSVRCVAE